MNTKLAAIYNVFDGEELLIDSIKSIRNVVDVVIVIQQQISNFGNKSDINVKNFLESIDEVDIVVDYHPDLSIIPEQNEFNKRIVGLKKAIEIGCTHYLHMDCDEEYEENQFRKAFQSIIENNNDSSAVDIVNYFKFKNLRIEEPAGMYVPFIHKIQKGKMKLSTKNTYPVLVDKTRKGNPVDNFVLFTKDDICMHHFSWVRNDIRKKIENSTARGAFENIKEQIVTSYDNFTIEERLVKIGNLFPLPESILSVRDFKNYKYVDTSIVE